MNRPAVFGQHLSRMLRRGGRRGLHELLDFLERAIVLFGLGRAGDHDVGDDLGFLGVAFRDLRDEVETGGLGSLVLFGGLFDHGGRDVASGFGRLGGLHLGSLDGRSGSGFENFSRDTRGVAAVGDCLALAEESVIHFAVGQAELGSGFVERVGTEAFFPVSAGVHGVDHFFKFIEHGVWWYGFLTRSFYQNFSGM